ncbi:MAG: hypothetical protein GY714_03415 [Desulfobacterales bacterium]|nr:hypothetical protein [Desulfobacterales bacterium]
MEKKYRVGARMYINCRKDIGETALELKIILGDIVFDLDKSGDYEEVCTFKAKCLGHEIILQDTTKENMFLFEIYPYDYSYEYTEILDVYDMVFELISKSDIECDITRLPILTE